MKFEDSVADQAVVVCVEGRVDASNATLFEGHCKRQMTDHQRRSLVLDMSKVEYLSSAGLRAILSLGKQTQAGGGKLVLCGLSGVVREIFAISGFLNLFPVADTLLRAVGLAMDAAPPSRPRTPRA
jgi:anti-anti-sigma factor